MKGVSANDVDVTQQQRTRVASCPRCGGPLLFLEGVAHQAKSVEIDEEGTIYGVEFADPKPVAHHSTTWLECDNNCDWNRDGFAFEFFPES